MIWRHIRHIIDFRAIHSQTWIAAHSFSSVKEDSVWISLKIDKEIHWWYNLFWGWIKSVSGCTGTSISLTQQVKYTGRTKNSGYSRHNQICTAPAKTLTLTALYLDFCRVQARVQTKHKELAEILPVQNVYEKTPDFRALREQTGIQLPLSISGISLWILKQCSLVPLHRSLLTLVYPLLYQRGIYRAIVIS